MWFDAERINLKQTIYPIISTDFIEIIFGVKYEYGINGLVIIINIHGFVL